MFSRPSGHSVRGNYMRKYGIKLGSNYVVSTANANGQFVAMQYVFRLTSRPSHLIAYDYNTTHHYLYPISLVTILQTIHTNSLQVC